MQFDPLLNGLGSRPEASEYDQETEATHKAPEVDQEELIESVRNTKDSSVPPTQDLLDRITRSTEASSVNDEKTPVEEGNPKTSKPVSIPVGAICAKDSLPFNDFDSAEHKANQMSRQLDEQFFVRAIAQDQFVVCALQLDSSSETRRVPVEVAVTPTNEEIDSIPYDQGFDCDNYIASLPPSHPLRRCGRRKLARYMRPGFKYRPCYRSMIATALLIPIGLYLYIEPDFFLALIPQESRTELLKIYPANKDIALFGWLGLQTSLPLSGWLGIGIALPAMMKIFYTRYVDRYRLSESFAMWEHGIIARRSTKMSYQNVVNYDVDQNAIGRLLRYGTLQLSTAGSDGAELEMRNVASPRFVEAILELKKLSNPGN